MKIIRSQHNYSDVDRDNGYVFTEEQDLENQPSLTDPSQAMEARDILKYFSFKC